MVVLIELTIYNSPEIFHIARVRKSSKENYQQLLSDIEETNRKASLVTIEIGSLGHSLPTCHKSPRKTLPNIFTMQVQTLANFLMMQLEQPYAFQLPMQSFQQEKKLHWPTNRPLYFHDPNPNPIFSLLTQFFSSPFYYCLIVPKISFVLPYLLPLPNSCFFEVCLLCPGTLSLFLFLYISPLTFLLGILCPIHLLIRYLTSWEKMYCTEQR